MRINIICLRQYTMRYMKNKRMLKRCLISSVPSYSAISDYTTRANSYVQINHLLNFVILNKKIVIAIDITKWKREKMVNRKWKKEKMVSREGGKERGKECNGKKRELWE